MKSLKKHTIQYLLNWSTLDEVKGHSIWLLTPAGVITGEVVGQDDEGLLIASVVSNGTQVYKDETNCEFPLDGDDGYIALRNASIVFTSGFKQNTSEMIVFYDQIIAATIGQPDIPEI